MRVKLMTTMAGPQGAVTRGSVVELDADLATELLRTGQAVPVERVADERGEAAAIAPAEETRDVASQVKPKPKAKAKAKR